MAQFQFGNHLMTTDHQLWKNAHRANKNLDNQASTRVVTEFLSVQVPNFSAIQKFSSVLAPFSVPGTEALRHWIFNAFSSRFWCYQILNLNRMVDISSITVLFEEHTIQLAVEPSSMEELRIGHIMWLTCFVNLALFTKSKARIELFCNDLLDQCNLVSIMWSDWLLFYSSQVSSFWIIFHLWVSKLSFHIY